MRTVKYVEWDTGYSVEVPEIDNQHKELMNLLNNSITHSSGNSIEERKYFDKIINTVIKFLENYFQTEEEILLRTEYKKINEHKAEHNNLLEKMKRTVKEIENNEKELNLFELTAEMKETLINHIITYDKEAKEKFKEGKKIK